MKTKLLKRKNKQLLSCKNELLLLLSLASLQLFITTAIQHKSSTKSKYIPAKVNRSYRCLHSEQELHCLLSSEAWQMQQHQRICALDFLSLDASVFENSEYFKVSHSQGFANGVPAWQMLIHGWKQEFFHCCHTASFDWRSEYQMTIEIPVLPYRPAFLWKSQYICNQ